MKDALINESCMGTYCRKSEKSEPLQRKLVKGSCQDELRKRMRVISGIALGSLIGIGLWALIISPFLL